MESAYESCRNKIGMNCLVVWGENVFNVSFGSHVLYTTSKLVNSRRCWDEDGKEMHQNEKRTCREYRAFVFDH